MTPRRRLGGVSLATGVVVALSGLYLLAEEIVAASQESPNWDAIAAAGVGVLLGLIMMGLGTQIGR